MDGKVFPEEPGKFAERIITNSDRGRTVVSSLMFEVNGAEFFDYQGILSSNLKDRKPS